MESSSMIFSCLGIIAIVSGICAFSMWLYTKVQGNKALKLLKLFGCLLLGTLSIVGGFKLIYGADIREIEDQYNTFYKELYDADYEAAFKCMSPEYRRTHTIMEFKDRFGDLVPEFPLQPGRYLRVWVGKAELYPRKSSFTELWCGPIYEFVKVDGYWYLTGEYDYMLD